MPTTLSSAPTFGGLQDGVTKGAAKIFSVVELRSVGGANGRTSLQPTGVNFRWSSDDHSIPRGPWVFGVKQRTVREDYPGSETPSEQILGWNYEPFTLHGIWDDRYAGENFALNTWLAFEALTKRGNPVRLSFERVTITGIITGVQFSYKWPDYIEYSFTVSPHFRTPDETVLDLSPDRKDRLMTDPRETVQIARRGLADVQAAQALATAENLSQVQGALSTTVFQDVQAAITQADSWITAAENVVEGQLFVPNEAANAFGRCAQLMSNTRDTSDTLVRALRDVDASSLALSTAVAVLDFETWRRGVCASSRALALKAEIARRETAARAVPSTIRLHRGRQGESLYSISNLYYGTPHQWRLIAERNGLTSTVLAGGELLLIPELGT